MPKNKVINQDQKKRIQDLTSKGLTTKEIATLMNISEKSVIRNKGGNKIVRPDKNIKSDKGNRKRRLGDSDVDISKKRTNLPGSTSQDNVAVGEKTEQLESLVFVGGKKPMTKKEEKKESDEEKNYYRCFNCHYFQENIFTECPKCGVMNVFEE